MTAPFLTNTPGVGGSLKARHEDFVVEEIPLGEFAGRGSFTLLKIRKRGRTTHAAVAQVARAAGVPVRQVGFAGIKDSRAITEQWLSLPSKSASRLSARGLDQVEVVERTRHHQPLQPGDLWGNRFEIRLRKVDPEANDQVSATLSELEEKGIPNYFGAQRFGTKGDSDQIGRALLQNNFDEALRLYLGAPSPLEGNERIHRARQLFEEDRPEEALKTLPRWLQNERRVLQTYLKTYKPIAGLAKLPKSLRLLFLSAYQSRLFNRCLARRLPDIHGLLEGDLAYDHHQESTRRVGDLDELTAQTQRLELSPTGPLFGPDLELASGEAGAIERAVFEEESLDPQIEDTPFHDVHLKGMRRPLRSPVFDLEWSKDGSDLLVSFRLPRGTYATSLLRELQKTDEPVDLI